MDVPNRVSVQWLEKLSKNSFKSSQDLNPDFNEYFVTSTGNNNNLDNSRNIQHYVEQQQQEQNSQHVQSIQVPINPAKTTTTTTPNFTFNITKGSTPIFHITIAK